MKKMQRIGNKKEDLNISLCDELKNVDIAQIDIKEELLKGEEISKRVEASIVGLYDNTTEEEESIFEYMAANQLVLIEEEIKQLIESRIILNKLSQE